MFFRFGSRWCGIAVMAVAVWFAAATLSRGIAAQLDPGVKAKLLQGFARLSRFQASFRQETYSDYFEDSRAEGEIRVARPGKLRLDYLKGDRKLVIWDGQTCYERDVLADTESRTDQEEVRQDPLVRLLLYGSDLERLFLIDRYRRDETEVFRLRPRDRDDYALEVVFGEDWLPLQVEVLTEDGEGTRFFFSDYRLDPHFKDATFVIPEPAERP